MGHQTLMQIDLEAWLNTVDIVQKLRHPLALYFAQVLYTRC